MPVYLVIHRDDGFLGAVRAVRADSVDDAKDWMRRHCADAKYVINTPQDYDYVCIDSLMADVGVETLGE